MFNGRGTSCCLFFIPLLTRAFPTDTEILFSLQYFLILYLFSPGRNDVGGILLGNWSNMRQWKKCLILFFCRLKTYLVGRWWWESCSHSASKGFHRHQLQGRDCDTWVFAVTRGKPSWSCWFLMMRMTFRSCKVRLGFRNQDSWWTRVLWGLTEKNWVSAGSFTANIFNRERKANKRGRGNKWGTALSRKFIKGSPSYLLESIIH